jgi:hypothetical protein
MDWNLNEQQLFEGFIGGQGGNKIFANCGTIDIDINCVILSWVWHILLSC